MAHSGFLKPKSGRLIRIGFLFGAIFGACLTVASSRLSTSNYRLENDVVLELSHLCWRVLTIPAAIIASIVGIDVEFNSVEPALGDLCLMILANGVLFGVLGAFVGWWVARSRMREEFPEPSIAEKMLNKGIPAWTVYWRTIRRRSAWGGLFGFIINLAALGFGAATSGGHSLSGWIAAWLSRPTYVLGNALCGWPNYDSGFTLGLVLAVSFVNALFIALMCMCITAVMETWLFFRKR